MSEMIQHDGSVNTTEIKNRITGIETGLKQLDRITGGFQNSKLIVIGAGPSMGKTAFALSLLQHIAIKNNIPAGFFSLEIDRDRLKQKLVSQLAQIPLPSAKEEALTKEESKRLQDATNTCKSAPVYINDTPNMKLSALCAASRHMKEAHNVKIVFIDYLGLITLDNEDAMDLFVREPTVSKTLKNFAVEQEIPIVAFYQVARTANRELPDPVQLQSSAFAAQDADTVMFISAVRKLQFSKQPPKKTAFLQGFTVQKLTEFLNCLIHGKEKKQVVSRTYSPVQERKLIVARQDITRTVSSRFCARQKAEAKPV